MNLDSHEIFSVQEQSLIMKFPAEMNTFNKYSIFIALLLAHSD